MKQILMSFLIEPQNQRNAKLICSELLRGWSKENIKSDQVKFKKRLVN